MAKGIGGEDGPSIWTFLCVILVWKWFTSEAAKLEKKVEGVLHIGVNDAGPLQKQTTSQIANMEKKVARIPLIPAKLKFDPSHYAEIADMLWSEMNSTFYTDKNRIFEALEPLTVYELNAVAKKFGVRETSVLGLLTMSTYTIFTAFDGTFSDGLVVKDLTRMKRIWAKTGLWH